MQQVVYAKFSRERKPEFQTHTRILVEPNGVKHVEKRALTKMAEQHVDSLTDKYIRMCESIGDVFDIVQCESIAPGIVSIPFVEGQTFSQKLHIYVESGKIEEAEAMICTFCEILKKKAKISHCSTDAFDIVFGKRMHCEGKKAIFPANIDLIFDNFLVNHDDRLSLIDYEWVFPFSIPVDFIIFRSLFLSREFQNLPEESIKRIWNRLEITQAEQIIYLEMECCFQRYVSGYGYKLSEIYQKLGKSCYCVKENRVEIIETVRLFVSVGENWQEANDYILKEQVGAIEVMIPAYVSDHAKIVLPNQNAIIKISVADKDGKPVDFRSNCDLQISDDYYFASRPEIYVDCGEQLHVLYSVIESNYTNLGLHVELLKKEHAQTLEILRIKDLCTAYEKQSKEFQSAYEQESTARKEFQSAYEQESAARKEFQSAYEQESAARKEFQSAYEQESTARKEFQGAYEQESAARKEFQSAYEQESTARKEFQSAYEQESTARKEFQKAYEQESAARKEFQGAYEQEQIRNKTIQGYFDAERAKCQYYEESILDIWKRRQLIREIKAQKKN